ncbi:MAG: sigma-70 family RNA polymerase sigma factor [bacterium]
MQKPRTDSPRLRISDDDVVALSADEFVERCRDFVHAIVMETKRELNLKADTDDLVSCGFLGLLQARSRFEPTTRAEFATFAYWRVRGAILDGCRKSSDTSRRYKEKTARLNAAFGHAELVANEQELVHQGVVPTPLTAASATNMLADHIANVIIVSGLASNFQIVFTEAGQEKRLMQSELFTALKEALETLSDMERDILRRIYYECETTEEIGARYDHTKSWVSRMHSRIVNHLQKHFRNRGLLDA